MKKLIAALALCSAFAAAAQDSVRPELAKPLQAAQEAIQAGRPRDALAHLNEADALPQRTAYESFVIERMRGSAAILAGEHETVLRAFDAVLASGRLPADERLRTLEALAGTALRVKDYARSAAYAKRAAIEGATSPALQRVLAQALYHSGQYADAARELTAQWQAAEQQGRSLGELELQLLANCQAKLDDRNGYFETLLRLLTHHPKPEYWADALNRVRSRPGFSDRLALDLHRLRVATEVSVGAEDDLEMGQLALQAGIPAEALRVIDAGFAAGRLGVGAEAGRHRRIRELALKQVAEDARNQRGDLARADAAPDGQGLVQLGLALVMAGEKDKGLAAIERGLARGGLKRPQEAQLHHALALVQVGHTAQALAAFKQVRGGDGSSDLARLWVAHLL